MPIQLTYNPGPDLTPAFLPGDTVVLYSYTRHGGLAVNQCLGALPVGGRHHDQRKLPQERRRARLARALRKPGALNDSIIVLVQSAASRGAARTRRHAARYRPVAHAPTNSLPGVNSRVPSPAACCENSASYLSLIGGE